MKRYNNYHKHTHVSSIFWVDSNTKAEEYIKKSVEYGHTHYFTTEHGTMGDIFEAKTLCDQYGLKCIAAIEGYIVPNPYEKDSSNYHIVIVPRTNKARRKVNLITSRASIEGFYYRPRIFLEDLLKLDKDDVYITSACIAGLLKDEKVFKEIFLPLYQHFGKNLLLEVQNHNDSNQKEINKKALILHEKLGLKLIAANDSHYVDNNGKQQRLNLLLGKGVTYGDEDNFNLDFPDYEEMYRRFIIQGVLNEEQITEAIDNTLIFDNCEALDINKEIKMPTIYPQLSLQERFELLEKKVIEAFIETAKDENIAKKDYPRYVEGIKYELEIIRETNDLVHTADYFLFNTKMVDIAVNKYGGVLTRTGRGSCASFYINKLLGMTQIDRFAINLPLYPDRFASSARLIENRALPDIDYNVKSQEEFVQATRDLLGEHGCYPMIAYGTMQLGEAFRNVCRSHGYNYDEYNEMAKNIEMYLDRDDLDPKWQNCIEESKNYVNTIISASVHPCAHILSNDNLLEEYGVVRIGENLCVMITSAEADEYKVLKNDYLIVTVWKLISETFNMAGKPILKFKDLLDSIKDDQRVWDLFKNGITCTLNQVDSDNGTMQAKRYELSSFEEGAFLAAAIRPSFDSWREDFLERKPNDTGSKIINELLSNTRGYILFQESLMQFFEFLGVTPAESIGLIKKISKKKIKEDDFAKLEDRLRKNWVVKTGSEDGFSHTWELIQSCMAYGFAAPHAAATSGDMCYGAYLKVNYPDEYYAVALENYRDDMKRTSKLKNELNYFNIDLKPIQYGKSLGKYTLDKDNHVIYKGIGSIKYCNNQIADDLMNVSTNYNYIDFLDLLHHIRQNRILDRRQLSILIKLNFFKEFGGNKFLLRICEVYEDTVEKNRKQYSKKKIKDYVVPEYLLKKYATKETNTLYKEVDNLSMVKEYISTFDNTEHLRLIEQMCAENEFYGYIETVASEMPETYYMVTKFEDKGFSSIYLNLHRLNDGTEVSCKIYKKNYTQAPFDINSVLKTDQINERFKKRPDGNGNWVAVNELEKVLNGYEVIA